MITRLSTHALAALAGFAVFWVGFFPSRPPTSNGSSAPFSSGKDNAIKPAAASTSGVVASTQSLDGSSSAKEGRDLPDIETILALRDPVARLDALTNWAQNLAKQGVAGVSALKGIKNKVLRMGAEAAFYSTLAEQDASLAFRLAKSNGLAADNPVWGGLFQGLAMVSPKDAAAAVSGLPAGALRSRMVNTVAGTWGERNLNGAAAWAATLNPVEKAAALTTIFEAGAAKSPSQASAAALALPAGKSRCEALSTVASHLATQNPQQALAWAEGLKGSDYEAAVRGILSRLSTQAPEQAAQWIDKLPAGKAKRDLTQEIVGQMALNDPEAALKWLEQRGETNQPASVAPALWVMAESNPDGALAAFSANLGHPELAEQAAHLAEALVQKNGGENSMQAALSLADDAARQTMVEKVAREWALADPKAAWELAKKNPDLLGAMIPALSSAAPAMVSEQLKSLPTALQAQAAPYFAKALAETDPAGAAALLNQHNGSDPAWGEAVNAVSSAWAELDPSAAANASMNMAGPAGEVIRAKAVEQWLYQDITGACGWIQHLPQGNAKDEAIAALVQYAAVNDPQGARSWLPLVSNPALRASLNAALTGQR